MRRMKEWACPQCGERLEREEPITNAEPQPPRCGFCGIDMEWAPTGMSFGLKGGGWPSKTFRR